ncbi:MAG: response regulator [Candidatus Omnitrophica bacterium]|nr:response regulator [Candidatus Omnitrophota bacterium]
MEKKILVVDDDPKICELLERFLIKKDFQPTIATSGKEALEKVKAENPAIVLLDIKMPDMDGINILKKIKETNERTAVIMITGLKDEEIAKEAMASGAYDYITKPFDLDYLEMCLLTKIIQLTA